MTRTILGCAEPSTRRWLQRALAGMDGVTITTTAPGLAILAAQIRKQRPDVCLVEAELLDAAALPHGTAIAWVAVGRDTAPKNRPACPWVELPKDESEEPAFVDALRRTLRSLRSPAPQAPATPRPRAAAKGPIAAVGIAVSTGGPEALRTLLAEIPSSFAPPILITQHIPAEFSASLARSLDRAAALDVSEARHREPVDAGRVYLAPGGYHMEVVGTADDPRIRLQQNPPELAVRPCANVMLRSMAAVFGARTMAVVMTGMGRDGEDGCAAVRAAGGRVVAQDESSSVVHGMPRAVVEAGLADRVVALEDLAAELCYSVEGALGKA